ncbi:MAG: SDR family NAD(P)-dependent oxidoreductase, partial [Boseongicola sp. SB0662_bin_57]|nr:SDR family NAD(P)-dependent oxidoreductase [Boseongicola sp. SB0662_bin_57]
MLNGKAIIVTGAAQGIGAAMAAGFSRMGAQVALSDIDDAGGAAERINGTGGRAIAIQADVTSLASCDEMVARTEEVFGRLDGLVCNAALFSVLPIQDFDEIEPDLWDQV